MNIFEAIDELYMNLDEIGIRAHYAMQELLQLATAYNALAPTAQMWKDAPEWAEWYVISGSVSFWTEIEPEAGELRWRLADSIDDRFCMAKFALNLPLGIDPRLCKWQRPAEVQP